jgi:hypothetical protein
VTQHVQWIYEISNKKSLLLEWLNISIKGVETKKGRAISDPAIKFHKGRFKNYLLLMIFVKINY